MDLHYCHQCGARISAADIAQGRARKVDEFNYNCPNCGASKSARISGGRSASQVLAPLEGNAIPLPLIGGGVAVVTAILVVVLYLCFGPADEGKRAGPAPAPKPAPLPVTPQPTPVTGGTTPTGTPEHKDPVPDEKAAEEAFAALERFEGLGPDDRLAKIARTQAFLLTYGRARVAERARNLINDLKKPPEAKPEPKTETAEPPVTPETKTAESTTTKAEPTAPPDKAEPAAQAPDPKAEYAKFLVGLQALITQKGWELARSRVADAAKDPKLASFTQEVRLDGECLALAERAAQAASKGAALLLDGRSFSLVQTDGKRIEVGKGLKAVVQKFENDTLRIEQDLGGGRAVRTVALAKLDAETCLGLSRLALSDPEGKLALALLKLPALREAKAAAAAEEMRKLCDQARKEGAPEPKVARVRGWVEFVEREQAAAQALHGLETVFAGKLGDEAAAALAEFRKSHAGTAVLDEAAARLREMDNALSEARKLAALRSFGDFDAGKDGYGLHLGWEFPGAQGSMDADKEQKKSGAGSLRLRADFAKGGSYVAAEKKNLNLDVGSVSFWVRTDDLNGVSVRLGDGGDQCHQIALPLTRTSSWQEVKVDIERQVGKDHWGGKNDGKWRAPLKYFAVLIGKGHVPAANPSGTLWLDQVRGAPRAP